VQTETQLVNTVLLLWQERLDESRSANEPPDMTVAAQGAHLARDAPLARALIPGSLGDADLRWQRIAGSPYPDVPEPTLTLTTKARSHQVRKAH